MMTIHKENVELYQRKVKMEFLDTLNEGTRLSYQRILKQTAEYEEKRKKDLYNFTLKELEEILVGFQSNNRNTLESYARIISSYLNWAVETGKAKSNPLWDLKPTDFEKYLIDREQYLSRKQIIRYIESCENYQDAVVAYLLFIGVSGRRMSEIRNLKKSDVDYENKRIVLTNTLKEDKDGNITHQTQRVLNVDDYALELLKKASAESRYVKRNGEMKNYKNILPYSELIDNDYVIRAALTRSTPANKPVAQHVLSKRIQVLAESFDMDYFTAKFIQRSGMIYYAYQLVEGSGLITITDLKVIADRFNVTSYNNLRGFITTENVARVYGQ